MRNQRGLSLTGCVTLTAPLVYGAMAEIFATRYQRNLIAGSIALVMRSSNVSAVVERTQADSDAGLRKCRVAGKVVYSNVTCTESNRTTQSLEPAKNHGCRAPTTPPAVMPEVVSATERGLQRALTER